ncbi:Na+/H+ antiporter NhaA [Labrys monachus]|uniref:Na(+)/H(+) antiporter NhaA n=1 Tax=Labrys monachus TaxID=217067 RepID=A0ABU0FPA9_9HYPH|nr:Na+/H+ antiporter NhaA [Labrys monachus]MDQ0396447.1 NhaA family Na+:H+ antiporter [Labrys monachus]
MVSPRPPSFIRTFLATEAAGGVILMAVAALALAVANSPLSGAYFDLLHLHIGGLSLLHWINDGLMALFFLLVGLEIKREVLKGQLSNWPRRALPGVAALGGMVVPALVFVAVNWHQPETLRGWAIPSATDIAFALGVLALLGSYAPASLKVFLTALAIIDDLGAVLIIALFYTAGLDGLALAGVGVVLLALAAMNRFGVVFLPAYLALGAVLWVLTLMSGIHATLAGVALAFAIPLRGAAGGEKSPLHRLEHGLHPWVTFLIVPVFGFANAGVSLAGLSPARLADPVTLGVALGLFAGKQAGVFAFAALAIRAGWAELPHRASWVQLYGVALLCGIGFTMSLFIGGLAYADTPLLLDETKIGVLLGSVLSAVAGAILLRLARPAARRRL